MQITRLKGTLFPDSPSQEDCREAREEKIRLIKKMIKDDTYITHEKLNRTFEMMLEEVERE